MWADLTPEEALDLRAPPWTTTDQLLLARSQAQEAAHQVEDEARAETWRAVKAANPNPGPGGWRIP